MSDTEILDGVLGLLADVGTAGFQAIVELHIGQSKSKCLDRECLTTILQSKRNWLTWWIGYYCASVKKGKS